MVQLLVVPTTAALENSSIGTMTFKTFISSSNGGHLGELNLSRSYRCPLGVTRVAEELEGSPSPSRLSIQLLFNSRALYSPCSSRLGASRIQPFATRHCYLELWPRIHGVSGIWVPVMSNNAMLYLISISLQHFFTQYNYIEYFKEAKREFSWPTVVQYFRIGRNLETLRAHFYIRAPYRDK